MTSNAIENPVKLRTPADIVDAVPHLGHFHPADSVVVVALQGERRRLGVVFRIDLPPQKHASQIAEACVEYLRRNEASSAIVVFYPPSGGRAHPAVQRLADQLTKRLDAADIGLTEMLCVGEGRWWSLSCSDDACCPAGGTPLEADPASPVAAAMALGGRVTLPSRDDLARTLEPVAGLAAAAMSYALSRARQGLQARREDVGDGVVVLESIAAFESTVKARQVDDSPAPLDCDTAANLIAALDDVHVRDEIISWFDDDWGELTLAVMSELVRRAVPPFDIVPLTVYGWLSYLHGNGAIAGMAVDRVLAHGPGNGMLRILDDALRGGLNPETFKPNLRLLRRTIAAGAQHQPPDVRP
jgi:hypothetical protein